MRLRGEDEYVPDVRVLVRHANHDTVVAWTSNNGSSVISFSCPAGEGKCDLREHCTGGIIT